MESRVTDFVKEKKLVVVTGLLSFSFLTAILTIRKKTARIPNRTNNSVFQALGIATSIVGVSFAGIAFSLAKYMDVTSLEEFNVKSNTFIKDSFLKIEEQDKDDKAGKQFMQEWIESEHE
jgi:hypothetical protein